MEFLRRFVNGVVAAGSLLWLTACATYTDETKQVRELYRSAAYPQALKDLDDSGLKDQSRNRLLFRLERAMILDRMGQADQARKLLLEADKIADDLYTVSVSRTAASFVYNDSATDYSGEDYERVAIHTQLALSYIGAGDLPAARVEARKINSKLQEINQQYDDHKNRYAEDAFARYLAGLIYEARGEWDDAIIDYGKAIGLYRGAFAPFSRDGVPRDLVEAQARLLVKRNRQDQLGVLQKNFPQIVTPTFLSQLKSKDQGETGEVVVLHEVGSIAIKRTSEFLIPLGKHVIRLSFPVIQSGGVGFLGATGFTDLGSGAFYSGDNTSDMDAIASFTLEDRRGRLVVKAAARLIAKAQLTDQVEKQFGPLGWLVGNIYSAVTETADTRGWTLLPKGYFVTRARLPVGERTLKISSGGRIGTIDKVTIKKGQMTLLRASG